VSLPVDELDVSQFNDATWVKQNRRMAIELEAQDAEGSAWTLRYELEVRKHDRWYVQSLHVDPITEGDG